MKKKILAMGIALLVLFSLVALSACEIGSNNPTLAEYQATAVTTLETYAEGKGQANYTEANWTLLQSHVEAGRTAINEATDKAGVRSARDAAKQQIGIVPRESNMGSYTRHPNSIDTIDAQLENIIRQDYVALLNNPDITVADVWISHYFGTFNESSVVKFAGKGLDGRPAINSFAIDDMEFIYNHGVEYMVWNNGGFYSLEEAYDNKLLSIENIRAIYEVRWGRE